MNMRNYETPGTESNVDIEQLKTLMMQKLLLKEKMMHDLHINRQCALALENVSVSPVMSDQPPIHIMQSSTTPKEKRQQILCAAAWKKIAQVLLEKLNPRPITLPRRQDEYGKYLDEDDFLGLGHLQCDGAISPTSRNHTNTLDLNIFPLLFLWVNQHFHRPSALAMVFDIVCENPDVCGFHSARDVGKCFVPIPEHVNCIEK